MKSYILCDASYDKDLKVACIAGSTVYNGVGIRFNKIYTEVESSHHAEMMAVIDSIRKLKSRIKVDKQEIEHLHIITDNQSTISMFDKTNNGYRTYIKERTTITNLLSGIECSNSLHKVKSHQKKSLANSVESKHNEIDRLARDGLNSFRKSILEPVKDSQYVGLILDSNPSNKFHNKLYSLGKHLALNNKIPRLSFNDDNYDFNEHPFVKGYEDNSQDNKIRLMTWHPHYFGSNDVENGCCGADRVLIRKYNATQNKKIDENRFYDESLIRASVISRLMFGIQDRVSSKKIPSDRSEEPSSCIIDLTSKSKSKTSISAWSKKLLPLTTMNVIRAFNDIGVIECPKEKSKELEELSV